LRTPAAYQNTIGFFQQKLDKEREPQINEIEKLKKIRLEFFLPRLRMAATFDANQHAHGDAVLAAFRVWLAAPPPAWLGTASGRARPRPSSVRER
jgi:hypothetical protein